MVLRSAALAALLLFGVALAVLLPAEAPADHNGPLAGQWHLEGSADDSEADSSGHGLTGVAGSTGGGVEATAGRFGNGLLFDDFSSIRVAPSALLEPANVTLVAWVKSDGTPGVTNTIVAKGGDPACTASSYALDTGAGGLEFYVRGPAGNARFSSPAAAASTVWDNQWHGVAGVYDGTMVRLYVDGHQVGSGTPGPPNIAYNRANREFTMGEYPSCDNFGYGERLDEVQVYNRALNGSEIATLHDASATSPRVIGPSGGGEPPPPPPPPPSTPPTADFAFKQRSPTVARTIRLNGAASSAAPGRTIASYAWDLNRDGRFEFVARGDTPAISTTIRRPGRVTATLLVIDSAGETDTVSESFTVGRRTRTARPSRPSSARPTAPTSRIRRAASRPSPSRSSRSTDAAARTSASRSSGPTPVTGTFSCRTSAAREPRSSCDAGSSWSTGRRSRAPWRSTASRCRCRRASPPDTRRGWAALSWAGSACSSPFRAVRGSGSRRRISTSTCRRAAASACRRSPRGRRGASPG